jgi:asparagine synthetase B (glutamine-hydrolysing)
MRSAVLTASQMLLYRRSPAASRQIRRAIHIAQNASPSAFLTELISYITEAKKEALVRPEAREGLLPVCRLYEPHERGWLLEDLSGQLTNGLFHHLLPSDMLKKADMMSMKNSVEIRAPLLDEQVVDFALSIAHELKANSTKNKIVLRELASQRLPEEITRAKKHGFGVPLDVLVAPTLKSALREWLLEPGARIRAIVNPTIVEGWVRSFEGGSQTAYASEISREGLYQRLFFLFALEIWMCKHHLSW